MCSRGVYIPTNKAEEGDLLNAPSFLRVNSFVDDDTCKVEGKLLCNFLISIRIYVCMSFASTTQSFYLQILFLPIFL